MYYNIILYSIMRILTMNQFMVLTIQRMSNLKENIIV